MKKKRTEIRFELEQVLLVRRRRTAFTAWCAGCQEQVTMIKPEEAALLSGLSLRAVCRRVEAGELHFTESPDGGLWICLNSIQEEP